MKIYAAHGIREFVLVLGYKGKIINNTYGPEEDKWTNLVLMRK